MKIWRAQIQPFKLHIWIPWPQKKHSLIYIMLSWCFSVKSVRAPNICSFLKFEIGFKMHAPWKLLFTCVQLAYLKCINSLQIFLMFVLDHCAEFWIWIRIISSDQDLDIDTVMNPVSSHSIKIIWGSHTFLKRIMIKCFAFVCLLFIVMVHHFRNIGGCLDGH